MSEISELLLSAVHAAFEAGKMTLGYYQTSSLKVDRKNDQSPVTVADRSAEEWLREFIQKEFPGHGILGEEFGELEGKGAYRWILDPIDGTKSFIHGVPFYGTMIAIEDLTIKDSVVGVVNFPALGESIWASKNGGTFVDGRRVQVSTVGEMSEATLLAADLRNMKDQNYGPLLNQLVDKVRLARTWGDCYGHYLVATGRAEIMVDPKLNMWDVAPLKPIIEEAGGQIFDCHGKGGIYIKDAVACNEGLAEQVRRILKNS